MILLLLNSQTIHTGSLGIDKKLSYGVDLVNFQSFDLIVFTVDLVNNKVEKMKDWMCVFGRLKAAYGVFLYWVIISMVIMSFTQIHRLKLII
ncbi:MAG: hypothetical protein ACMUEM_02395 [Flavobacteriales bacterium AspAUS03]